MKSRLITLVLLIFSFLYASSIYAEERGIYINEDSSASKQKMTDLINNAKAAGINTFVIDYEVPSKAYADNMKLVKQSGIKYVARIIIFPGGATTEQVKSQAYLQKRIKQIDEAIGFGADEIQIDYIRYKASNKPSEQNAKDIANVIAYFSNHLKEKKIPLQIDVFGISSFKPSIYIGQDNSLIAPQVSSINPMVYPSHYTPYAEHAKTPYTTVHSSLVSLKNQIKTNPNVKVTAFIEIFNFRHPMGDAERTQYILAEMQAVKDAGINGWYVWSDGNKYDFLFSLLKQVQAGKVKLADNYEQKEKIGTATKS